MMSVEGLNNTESTKMAGDFLAQQSNSIDNWKNMSDRDAAQTLSDYRHKLDTAFKGDGAYDTANGDIADTDLKAIAKDENQPMALRQAAKKYLEDDAFAAQLNGGPKGTANLSFESMDKNLSSFGAQGLGGNASNTGFSSGGYTLSDDPYSRFSSKDALNGSPTPSNLFSTNNQSSVGSPSSGGSTSGVDQGIVQQLIQIIQELLNNSKKS